jgi:hypothetical protein
MVMMPTGPLDPYLGLQWEYKTKLLQNGQLIDPVNHPVAGFIDLYFPRNAKDHKDSIGNIHGADVGGNKRSVVQIRGRVKIVPTSDGGKNLEVMSFMDIDAKKMKINANNSVSFWALYKFGNALHQFMVQTYNP